ncbi:hypothetical protein Taro_037069 [Colocasia esculenta]|uniref:DJ-1/PfpI domain-containing protein n=1 Tax=Colocasia esculenta TaxID=4460 RepID=A0A843WBQ0_COLES|nr:hypothetical protein [Colocasia esculenta]
MKSRGKKCTAYPAVKLNVILGGATWLEPDPIHRCFTDGNLVTGAAWPGHPEFVSQFMELLAIKVLDSGGAHVFPSSLPQWPRNWPSGVLRSRTSQWPTRLIEEPHAKRSVWAEKLPDLFGGTGGLLLPRNPCLAPLEGFFEMALEQQALGEQGLWV